MRIWTKEEELLLSRLYVKDRKFVPEIASELNRTKGSIANKIGKLGLTLKSPADFGW